MKYVIIADLHVKTARKYDRLINGLPESIYWPLHNLRLAAEYAHKHDAQLIIAGDVNDSKRLVSQQVITETLNTLEDISGLVDTYLILGNHDYELYQDKIYSYLLNINNLTVIKPNEPLVLNGELGLVAYNYDRSKLLEDIVNIDPLELKGIVSHFGLKEGKLSGSEYRTGEFSLHKDFVGLETKWLVLGHYHMPQEVSDRCLYVGSPYPIRIDEAFDNKRFILLDLDENKYTSIPTEYPKYKKVRYRHKDIIDIDNIIKQIEDNDYMIRFYLEIQEGHSQLKELKVKLKDYQSNIYIKLFREDNKESKLITTDINDFNVIDLIDAYLDKIHVPEDKRHIYKDTFNSIVHLNEE